MALVGSDHPECVWPCNTRNQAAPFAGNSFRAGTRPEAGVTAGNRATHIHTSESVAPFDGTALLDPQSYSTVVTLSGAQPRGSRTAREQVDGLSRLAHR